MENSLVCKSRTAASAALETIADSLPRGMTQRNAILAVREWLIENSPPDFNDETMKRLQRIFEGDEADKLGLAWYNRGSKVRDGKLEPTTPAHGARVSCLWNARTKKWEPEAIPPAHQEEQKNKPEAEG